MAFDESVDEVQIVNYEVDVRHRVSPVWPVLALPSVETLDQFLRLEDDYHADADEVAGFYVLFVFFAWVQNLDDERNHVEHHPDKQLKVEEHPGPVEERIIDFHKNGMTLNVFFVLFANSQHQLGNRHNVSFFDR